MALEDSGRFRKLAERFFGFGTADPEGLWWLLGMPPSVVSQTETIPGLGGVCHAQRLGLARTAMTLLQTATGPAPGWLVGPGCSHAVLEYVLAYLVRA